MGHVTEDAAKARHSIDHAARAEPLKAQIGALAVEDQFAVEKWRLPGAVIVYRADSA